MGETETERETERDRERDRETSTEVDDLRTIKERDRETNVMLTELLFTFMQVSFSFISDQCHG